METMKCVVVGDEGVGKSALLLSCLQDTLPQEYIPRVIDNFIVQVFVGDRPTSIILWDTAGNEEYDGIRRLMYSQVDVFLLCFSVINRASLENVLHKWLEEIRNFSEEVPIILIGTKVDLRKETVTHKRHTPSSHLDGQSMGKNIKAFKYVECSAVTKEGLRDVFDEAVKAHRFARAKDCKQRTCIIM